MSPKTEAKNRECDIEKTKAGSSTKFCSFENFKFCGLAYPNLEPKSTLKSSLIVSLNLTKDRGRQYYSLGKPVNYNDWLRHSIFNNMRVEF